MKYFVPIKRSSPIWRHYMYMDARSEYHVDSLLAKHGIKARFWGHEWVSPDGKYRFLYVAIPKKQAPTFEAAMAEVPGRMALLGYTDYAERWEQMMNFF